MQGEGAGERLAEEEGVKARRGHRGDTRRAGRCADPHGLHHSPSLDTPRAEDMRKGGGSEAISVGGGGDEGAPRRTQGQHPESWGLRTPHPATRRAITTPPRAEAKQKHARVMTHHGKSGCKF